MKRMIIGVFALVMLLAFAACGEKETNEIRLGTSDFSIILPEGYKETADEYDEDQIAYYYKDDDSVDFDVYQWEKDGIYTLESEAQYFADEYGAEVEAVVINGINGMKYVSEEEYDDYIYKVVNYMFEDDDSIVELCFWTIDTEDEYKAVDTMINTLKKN